MHRLKRFFLILIALWLPIQATAAATLSFCRHTTEPAAAETTHCHDQAGQSVAVSDPERDLACDNCALCHLASAAFLLAPADTLPLPAASVPAPSPIAAFASHITAPPQQPPRR